jgi:acyl-CoA synthetase (NDP forming)
VALKIGYSSHAAVAALSHTGAIVGQLSHQEAFFNRHGVIAVEDVGEIPGVLAIVSGPLPTSDSLAILTTTGGIATMLTDLCGRYQLPLAELSSATRGRIGEVLAETVMSSNVGNPIDLGSPGLRDPRIWDTGLQALLDDPNIGSIVVVLMQGHPDHMLEDVIRASRGNGKPIIIYWLSDEDAAGYELAASSGVPVFTSGIYLCRALLALNAYRRQAERVSRAEPVLLASATTAKLPLDDLMTEATSKRWLRAAGIPVPPHRFVPTAEDAAAIAEELGYPVVLKACDHRVRHKGAIGGVRLGILSVDELIASMHQMRSELAAGGIADVDGFLIEEQVEFEGPEWLVGVRNDFEFGPVIAFGIGGALAEALASVALEPAPLDTELAHEVIMRVRSAMGLDQSSRNALASLLVTVSELAWLERERLAELDLNPVVVTRRGAVALDALVVLGRAGRVTWTKVERSRDGSR